jgi:hypothetical protein
MKIPYLRWHREITKDLRYIFTTYGRPDTADWYENLEGLLFEPSPKKAFHIASRMMESLFLTGYEDARRRHDHNSTSALPIDTDPELQRIKDEWLA